MRANLYPAGHPRRTPRGSRGVSLIEVLVVLVLFSIGLIGLVGLQSRAVQFSVSAEDTGRASLLANELVAQMWAANTVSLPSATLSAWTARLADASNAGLPNGEATVTVTGNVARILITWRAPGNSNGQASRFSTDVLIPGAPVASAP
jgi:type IV pilus assembly protein PilV